MFFVTVLNADNLVYGKQSSKTIPPNTPERTFVEITEQEYSEISNLTLEQGGGPAWEYDGNAIVPRVDTRYVLEVSLPSTIIDENALTGVDLTVKDHNGNVLTGFNGSRRLGIRVDNRRRHVKAPFSNGTMSKNVRFADSGAYEIFSLEPELYKVAGDYEWIVEEIW